MSRMLRRTALALITANAALAIVILALGRMGETEGRVLGTSLLATFSALLAMVQVPAMSERRLGALPAAGIVACGVAFVMATIVVWADIRSNPLGRAAGSAYVVAIGAAIAAILSGWRIRGRAAWVGRAAYVLLAVATALVLGGIWGEFENEAYWRGFAVVAVLFAASGMAVPILSRTTSVVRVAVEHCPFCGADLASATDSSITCRECAHTFRVKVEA